MAGIFHTYGGDPLTNLAMEEAILGLAIDTGETLYRVWINRPSVIIGVSTDPALEVDLALAEKHGIPVLRRFSGGGAVYHDMGNINISIYWPRRVMDIAWIYREGTGLIRRILSSLGLESHVENMSDVVVDGYKVSGSSAWIGRATLFHATLLVDSDIDLLRRITRPRWDLVESGRVTRAKYNPENLSRFMDIDVDTAIDTIIKVIGGVRVGLPKEVWREVSRIRERYIEEGVVIQGEVDTEPPLLLL